MAKLKSIAKWSVGLGSLAGAYHYVVASLGWKSALVLKATTVGGAINPPLAAIAAFAITAFCASVIAREIYEAHEES